MYVTRPLSMYRRAPSKLSWPPPEGPNSGVLIIQDEEAEPTRCFGLCKDSMLSDLPFPQNKKLDLRYTTSSGEHQDTDHFYAVFIPVLSLPLSSNQYYVVKSRGRHKGEVYTSSTEEDMGTCCFWNYVRDVKPLSLDTSNEYQQFQIDHIDYCAGRYFVAKSVAHGGHPPTFLGRKSGWRAHTYRDLNLGQADGLNSTLRAQLPDFDFPLSLKVSNPVEVGKWYCPFVFIKESALKAEDQISESMYYQMTLEQNWEKIYECDCNGIDQTHDMVNVDCLVEREVIYVSGRKGNVNSTVVYDGVVWFGREEEGGVGLREEIVEKMKLEERKVGWIEGGGGGNEMRVKREEVLGEKGKESGWKRFGCFVLVATFKLRRTDGTLVFAYEFKHTHQIRSKWE